MGFCFYAYKGKKTCVLRKSCSRCEIGGWWRHFLCSFRHFFLVQIDTNSFPFPQRFNIGKKVFLTLLFSQYILDYL